MKFNLINTVTNRVASVKNVELSEAEVQKLNYAYALNTNSRFKYVPVKSKKKKEKFNPQNLFRYNQPV